MKTFFNEIDPYAAQWLRNLGDAGEISQGVVDERSIKEVRGAELAGVRRAHFFAGIGGWELALKIVGWGDSEIWTGSCPCQPYSSAGKQKGNADERNLWPDFFRLIAERRPKYVFGEQVASAIKHGWIDRVQADLEGIGYSVGYAVLGAHSVGANHIRQRLYWGAALGAVGDGGRERDERRRDAGDIPGASGSLQGEARQRQRDGDASGDEGATRGLAQDPRGLRRRGRDVRRDESATGELEPQGQVAGLGVGGGVSDEHESGREERGPAGISGTSEGSGPRAAVERDSATRGLPLAERAERGEGGDAAGNADGTSTESARPGPWSDFRLVLCTDGKARRTGARVFPLAYGLPRGVDNGGSWRKGLARSASRARIGMLKGSGNAIVPALAAEFIASVMEVL